MTQLSNNISAFIVHMLMECQVLMNPFYFGYIKLKPYQVKYVDWEKPFYFSLHNAVYLCTSVGFRNVRYGSTKYKKKLEFY